MPFFLTFILELKSGLTCQLLFTLRALYMNWYFLEDLAKNSLSLGSATSLP